MSDQIKVISAQSDRGISRRLLLLLRPHGYQLGTLIFLIAIATCLGVVPYVIIRNIIDGAIANHDGNMLLVLCLILFLATLVRTLLTLAQSLLNAKIAERILSELRTALFEKLLRMSMGFYTRTPAGDIYSRFSSDLSGVQHFMATFLSVLVSNLLSILAIICLMIKVSPLLAILSLAMLPMYIFNQYWSTRKRRPLIEERQRLWSSQASLIAEALSVSGALLAKMFAREAILNSKFRKHCEALAEVEVRQQIIATHGFMGMGAFLSALPAIVFLVGGWQLIAGVAILGKEMTVGTLFIFSVMHGALLMPASQLLNLQASVHTAMPLFQRIFGYLDMQPDIKNDASSIALDVGTLAGEVRFDNVSFDYRGASGRIREPATEELLGRKAKRVSAIAGVSFTISPGETVAIVGESGAGKTTVAYLLARLYEYDTGLISIDGFDIRRIDYSSLVGVLGFVTQETFLIHDTIRENIRIGRPEASAEAICAAAKAACIHQRIMELENGYDTLVGERGFALSTGEKQRISIARVFLKNPRIVVLDEATSSLDAATEREVTEAISVLMKTRTVLIIAHQIVTAMKASRIIVLDGGRAIEQGSHEELYRKRGKYFELYNIKSGRTPVGTNIMV